MQKNKKVKMRRKFVWIFSVFGILLIALGVYFGIYCTKKEANKIIPLPPIKEEKPKKVETEASIIMVGDALIHGTVYNAARVSNGSFDFKPMLDKIKPIVQKYDLAYYNQETILGGTQLGLSNYPRFNSPFEVGDAFLDTGFNMVSLASNHTMDKGVSGVKNSLDYWSDKKAYTAGSYSSFEERDKKVIKEVNGIKYSFLSYTVWTNGLVPPKGEEYLDNIYSDELAKADIERVREEADVVMVAMHWGTEYSLGVSEQQLKIANYLSSLGVDIIIGAHPHVVEPITFIGKTLVIYSLGNLISDQEGTERLTGLMAAVTINKTVENNITTISLKDVKADLVYTHSSYTTKRNFKVYPYQELNNTILANYMTFNDKYKKVVLSMDQSNLITWGIS
ncbi:MAG: CapA family protein [Bacilli bacterium]